MLNVKHATLSLSRLLAATFAVTLTFVLPVAYAHDTGEETVTPVMKQDIPKNAGDHILLATVNYAPGQTSKAHLHIGPIFAYVLVGRVTSQLGDGPLKTYGPGESWYEAPGTHHTVSRNASDTESAKLLVFAIVDGANPIKQPMPAH
ncbi:cupin domain-containing protein [Pseudomonas sp. 10B1]|uniref:cupin domain-containing protein n=1 Tax=unclassified Pseudomonas TaxID=196821 RepID=UPI002AB3F708|nr:MULTISPECIES: cupin domain-containing protein [unclassified Pseudomonas]MDY7560163.1 cupin domain-containing protein [Pseudomonas sp. AB6]MEA9975654.1 cupin domain-containing protein [Pseudomonas sp. RTS4]MEA9993860.1 cupin domain-containing protein [Pseudomonas sp. AA4]MEB0085460.1 cupin domain-containing protein [Pseudomonas sp. RTI1]MEB0124522.1 cupin domain-containing protein [Pseudomonas sp. CCC1.2]